MTSTNLFAASMLLVILAIGSSARAQSATISTPLSGAGANYYERIGVGFGGRVGNVFFNNGGMGALPPFGGHHPGNDARLGFGVGNGDVGFQFGIDASSGSDQSFSSVAPSVTVADGATGTFFSGQQRPFVTGLVPFVGHFAPGVGHTMLPPRVVSPLAERLSRLPAEGSNHPARGSAPVATVAAPATTSSAERGDLSLAEIRATQTNKADAQAAELSALLEAARLREEAGELGQALIDYGRAASRADGPLKEELRAKMSALRAQMKQRK